MIKIVRTNSDDADFRDLVRLLDSELGEIDGSEHAFYSQFNKTDKIKHVVVAYDGVIPAGCGAIKEYDDTTFEVKRMFVLPGYRNKGFGSIILKELEEWAKNLSCNRCLLETGKRQPDAIALYTKNGYVQIPNYGQYAGVENSVCLEKYL
jgi:GNAT superfamily N-acetyltransferase